ncbi:restriction endonuclease subunit S [Vibrio aestuarianus]|uniref:restriction endonuclease subunit S n=1 Tax=Vibrio aestuarianus TaxID=28171 RepID=UPI00237C6889|nr:restriction endonuclease subunit S [Vibrio aestuarianus]MDE1239221.1 restriction endonuclease subunit S [Vibrio aestuarianus]
MSELPKGWFSTKFTDYLDVNGGTQPPKKDFLFEETDGYIRLLQIRDFGKKPVPTYVPLTKKLRLCNEEDILIGRYGASLGRICTGMEGCYNVALAKVAIPKLIENRFVKYYLESELFQQPLRLLSRSAQNGFNKQDLGEFDFPLAPLAEQKRIVEKLDEVLAQVDTIKARLDGIPALLKRFRQSVLASAVSGKLTGVADFSVDKFSNLILEMKNGLSPKPNEDGFGSPILRISSVRPTEVDFEDHRFLECEDKTKNIYSLRDRDLLFTRYNGSLEFVGVCGIVSGIGDKTYLYPDKLIRVRTDEKLLLPEYAELFFCCASTRKTITDFVKSTSGQKGISGKDLKSVDVNYPNLTAQEEIVRLVDQYFAFADTIEAQVKKAQARVDNLTQSILAKAFRGELVAQDPNDEPADKLLERISAARKEAEALAKAAKKTSKAAVKG